MSDCILPENSDDRKGIPVVTGVMDYFPLAIAEVAKVSKLGNDKHNPGQPLHWDRSKSTDHADCIGRHLIDRGKFAEDGTRHSAALAWRALALLQEEMEREVAKKSDVRTWAKILNTDVQNLSDSADKQVSTTKKPKFEKGQVWKARNGQFFIITDIYEHPEYTYPIRSSGECWTMDGKFFAGEDESEFDLVSLEILE